jgi:hypothetical protein
MREELFKKQEEKAISFSTFEKQNLSFMLLMNSI